MDILRVKFTHYTKVRDRHPYTVYEIAVTSPSTISWVIYKRYKDFDKLHKMLKGVRLPTLPPKRLFQIMEATFVETRMAQLQEYMRKLLKLPNLVKNPVLIEFLKVPDSVKPMLLNDTNVPFRNTSTKTPSSGAGPRPSYPNKSYEERRVYQLVDALKSSPNRVAAIADFERYFFHYRPQLAKEAVRYLFLGRKTDQKDSGGLIQTCGNNMYSKVASRAALDLICRLLDVERNKDAKTFVDVFVGLGAKRLSLLNIQNHIIDERGSRLGAFRLLSVLRDIMGEGPIEAIIQDEFARAQYLRWEERKTGFVAPIYNEPQTTLLKSINLVDVSPKKVARDSFKSILEVAKSDNWITVKPMFRISKTNPSGTLGPEEKKDLSSNAPMLKIEYKMQHEMVVVRMKCIIDCSIDRITNLLLDTSKRELWDLKFHRGHVVTTLGPTSDIVHYVFKSFSSPYKYRDFCLLRSWTELQNGGKLIAMRSVIHPSVKDQKDCIRAILYPTGWIIVPAQPSEAKTDQSGESKIEESKRSPKSLVTFISQMDRESVLLVSPDLLGETDELLVSMMNLEKLLREDSVVRCENAPNASSLPSATVEHLPKAI